MSEAQDNLLLKRETLFNEFSNQLSQYLPELKDIFICPYCLRPFPRETLKPTASGNLLTDAHIVPDALDGKEKVMACKECNSLSGELLDAAFIHDFKQESFLAGRDTKPKPGRLSIDGNEVGGDITINADGYSGAFEIDRKRSNPASYDALMKTIKSGPPKDFNIQQVMKPISNRNIALGLLNMAFLRAFQILGYPYILSEPVHQIRLQLMSPNKHIIENFSALYKGNLEPKNIEYNQSLLILGSNPPGQLNPCFGFNYQHLSVLLPFQNDKNLIIYQQYNNLVNLPVATTSLKGYFIEERSNGVVADLPLVLRNARGQELIIISSQPDEARSIIQKGPIQWDKTK